MNETQSVCKQFYPHPVDSHICSVCNRWDWEHDPVAEPSSRGEPPVIRPPFQKPLTVVMLRDESDIQAEKDLTAIADGSSTVIRVGVPELYFHHLRLRVAQSPELADKIAVFYVMPSNEMREVELKSGQQIRWPVGFGDEIWNKEKEVQAVKIKEVGLSFDDELKWPAGFCQESLGKEIDIRKTRVRAARPSEPSAPQTSAEHLKKCVKEGPDCDCVTVCKFAAAPQPVSGDAPTPPTLYKYEIAAFVAGNPAAVDCWYAERDEEMARIVTNCSRREAGIAEVRILLNGSLGVSQ